MPKFTTLDGATLNYAVHDFTDPWLKPRTIVLQHGFARSGKFWFGIIPYLARFYRVVCPDMRGFGESVPVREPTKELSVDRCLEDIAAIADHLGEEKIHFVGESIAGGLGLSFAGKYPDRLRSLCVIAPAVYANEWIRSAYAVGYSSWEQAIRELGVEGWVRKSNTLARFPSETDPRFLDWYATEVGKAPVENVAAITRLAGSVDARPYLGSIRAPVLVLYPTGGQIATDEMKRSLEEKIPDVRIVHLRTSYQMLTMLRPAECAQEILNFAALQDGVVTRD
jgi:pimeloyl-ACP methyl ester carboxylesterase